MDGLFSVELSEKLRRHLSNNKSRVIVVRVELKKGPCLDGWCPMIRSVKCTLSGLPVDGMRKIDADGCTIFMEEDLYRSASKHRDRLLLDLDMKKQIVMHGLTTI